MNVPVFDEAYLADMRYRRGLAAARAPLGGPTTEWSAAVAQAHAERGLTPYEVLRERYARGFYTFAEFERFVGDMLRQGAA